MTYYHKKASLVPWIAGVALLAVFIGIVVHYTGDDEPEIAGPPLGYGRSMPESVPVPEPIREPSPEEEPYEPPPPPKPEFSAAQARKVLRQATKEWRAFTVRLCRTKKWKSDRAVAFLEKVTWNDRDLEKQHAHGLASLRTMLGVQTTDPVALAEALAGAGSLSAFFERNWSKVEVAWKPKPKETVLEDAWKPSRIRWGFPLDTPIEEMQEFQLVGLTLALEAWQMLVRGFIKELKIDEGAKEPKWRTAVGEGIRTQEAKMHAAFRVLLDTPEASVKEVVEEFVRRIEKVQKEEFARSMLERMDAALRAAEKAQ